MRINMLFREGFIGFLSAKVKRLVYGEPNTTPVVEAQRALGTGAEESGRREMSEHPAFLLESPKNSSL